MNIKRFTARTSSEALALVRQALGDDAVVLSTRPGANGVEVLALASDSMQQIEAAAARAPAARAEPPAPQGAARGPATLAERISARGERLEPRLDMPALRPGDDAAVEQDVQTLGMSTLTFQDYVRERMLRRRQTEIERQPTNAGSELAAGIAAQRGAPAPRPADAGRPLQSLADPEHEPPAKPPLRVVAASPRASAAPRRGTAGASLPVLDEPVALADDAAPTTRRGRAAGPREHDEMLGELRSVRSLIEERFGMLAFMEKLQRNPKQVALAQRLLDAGFSPGLVRRLVQGLPADVDDDLQWAAAVLERNLLTDEQSAGLEDHEGVFALIGPTGVGKTTSTAKIAAAFAARHGAANLGLVTLDAYRVAAHEQLRTYGRILGVPVHTAHDRASLEDLLELLSSKKLVLIDTAGMAQRDVRTRELLDMLKHPDIARLLVVNAAAQGETVEDVMIAYGVSQCHGAIVSKLDEAVKLGPALDALIRHKCRVIGVTNGQRVPEDWHRLSAQALVQRALRGGGSASWRLDRDEVNLLFAAGPDDSAAPGLGLHA